MKKLWLRVFMLGVFIPATAMLAGCPQGSGEQISVTPTQLNFGSDETQLTFEVTNSGAFFTTAQFVVTPQFVDWIESIEPSSWQSFTLGFGGGIPVEVTVTINRENLGPGVNAGIILVGPTSPDSSAETQSIGVRALGEGVVEGEAELPEGEGAGEGGGEGGGEASPEGEGAEPIVCPMPCEISACGGGGTDAGVEEALRALLELPILNQDPATADLDQNGIVDTAHGKLVDTILANDSVPVHCCVLAAWNTNLSLVQQALDEFQATEGEMEAESIFDQISEDNLARVFAGLATIGERETQTVLEQILIQLAIPIDPDAFDLSARMYVASDGDADLDGACNLAEYNDAGQDPFGFILFAIDETLVQDGGGCGAPCYTSTEGEEGEGVIGGEAGGPEAEEGEEGEPQTGVLCEVPLSPNLVVPPSGSGATGLATFSTFEDQVLILVEHSVPNPLAITIFAGLPGEQSTQSVFTLSSPDSPSFALVSPQFYEIVKDDHFIQITSDARPTGAIRGNIECAEEEGEGGGEAGTPEAEIDGEAQPQDGEAGNDGEAQPQDGEAGTDGEAEAPVLHSADYLAPFGNITLSELIRGIQFFNNGVTAKGQVTLGTYGCAPESSTTDDSYLPGSELRDCEPHDLDFLPQDWRISLTEILRLIQFFNGPDGAYFYCPGINSDDFCPGTQS